MIWRIGFGPNTKAERERAVLGTLFCLSLPHTVTLANFHNFDPLYITSFFIMANKSAIAHVQCLGSPNMALLSCLPSLQEALPSHTLSFCSGSALLFSQHRHQTQATSIFSDLLTICLPYCNLSSGWVGTHAGLSICRMSEFWKACRSFWIIPAGTHTRIHTQLASRKPCKT